MPDLRPLSDQELINTSHQLRREVMYGSSAALAEARRHEAELRRRFATVDMTTSHISQNQFEFRAQAAPEPATLVAATRKYIIATADAATQSGAALRILLHDLRMILKMDIAFVAELIDGQKIYREIDHAESSAITVKSGSTAPLETTLCQRVVDGHAPEIMRDARSEPSLAELAAVKAMDIGAYISTPVVLGDGTVYGTLCCISHTSRSALGSRQLDSLRYVAGIIAAELERCRG